MERNGSTTVETIRSQISDLVYVPPLFDAPKEGYLTWATHVTELIKLGMLDPKNPDLWEKYVLISMGELDVTSLVKAEKIRPGTISGNLIQNTGPSWHYGLLLPVVIMGDFEGVIISSLKESIETLPVLKDWIDEIQKAQTPEELFLLDTKVARMPISAITTKVTRVISAKIARLKFERGQPLYVYVLGSEERFRNFVPVLTYYGDKKYMIGHGDNTQKILADTHHDAIYKAREWYIDQRSDEIDAAKTAAHGIPKKIPPIVYDLLCSMIRHDKALLDDQETALAWENGAHGMYGAQGPDWCYYTECSANTAVQLAVGAQQQAARRDDDSQLLVRGLIDHVAEYLGFENVQEDKSGGYLWDSEGVSSWQPAETAGRGRVLGKDKTPAFLTEIIPSDSEAFSHQVKVFGKGKKLWVKSPVPRRWELTDKDVLFWSIHAGVVAGKKAKNK